MGSFLLIIRVFDPLARLYESPHTLLPFILKRSHHALSWMCFCGYIAWSNDSNCEVICILSIFAVVFGYLTPWGDHIWVFPHSFAINLKNPIMLCPECSLWWLCIIKLFKLSSYLPNTYSRGPFWLNFGHLIPHIYVPINIIIRRCCAIIFNEIPPCFVLIVFCGYYTLSNGPNYLHNTNIWSHFGQNQDIWPP